jgi:hypothetical protein
MCLSKVYLEQVGKRSLYAEEASSIGYSGHDIVVQTLFGEHNVLTDYTIGEVNLLDHYVILTKKGTVFDDISS